MSSGSLLSSSSTSLGVWAFLLKRGVEETIKEAMKEEDEDGGVESHDEKRVGNRHS